MSRRGGREGVRLATTSSRRFHEGRCHIALVPAAAATTASSFLHSTRFGHVRVYMGRIWRRLLIWQGTLQLFRVERRQLV